ncbi:HipA domain-containing protein [Candidatus Poriferisocius sp.]|uniref:HipA domain-containing protein n=1 Tax=Candidatus Poriferisocius sp. TaxID=3101276 RepID=UPI003B01862F
MSTSPISVLLGGRIVATITPDRRGNGSLRYADEHMSQTDAVPLSLSLPLSEAEFNTDRTMRWLGGLLPDNPRVLSRWYANEGVSPPTPLALLSTKVGRDCAGAVQIVPEGQEAELLELPGGLTAISDEEVASEVRQMASDLSYWMPDDEEKYFSLGGYQAKTALHRLSDGRWARPYGSVPTTHILKPSPLTQQASAIVEHVCLELARRLGMSAAESEMATFDETNVCVISRYDRRKSDGVWLRVHQEDMCQALGRQPQDKYEAHGGPGISQIGDAIRANCRDPEREIESFRDAILYCWLIVNRDAHARNYSVILRPSGVSLAPLYDLGSVLPGANRRIGGYEMAMRFGRDHTVVRSHADDSLSTLSAYLVANHQSTLDRAMEMAAGIVPAAEQTMNALPVQYQVPQLEKMLKRLSRRADECSDTVERAVRRLSRQRASRRAQRSGGTDGHRCSGS